MKTAILVGAVLTLVSCRSEGEERAEPAPVVETPTIPTSIEGRWRMQIESPGGPIPFFVRILPEGSSPGAMIENGKGEDPISSVERIGDNIIFDFDVYDSRIEATLYADASVMSGSWSKTTPKGKSILKMSAQRVLKGRPVSRFSPPANAGLASISGQWHTVFADGDGESVAIGEFEQEGQRVTGTFLTATGDYRFLDGDFDGTFLRLSTFDGAHAFLFTARLTADKLAGQFWSRDSYQATFSATRHTKTAGEILPDPYSQVSVTSDDQRLRFAFPDISGSTVTDKDSRFAGKVLIVDIFGTWCPNCNDIAPLLAQWHTKYRNDGFEVVALAYEFSGDPKRDREVLKKYRDKYDIEFPILLAGTSDKKDAAKTLPDLSAIESYPTTIFVGRDGKVRKIHSGFAGPGTGRHHTSLIAEMEREIVALLAEK